MRVSRVLQAGLPTQAMCKHLHVSTSGYYDWCRCTPSKRSSDDQVMTERIRLIHQMSDYTYGRHRIRAELVDMGDVVNLKRIERLMRLAGLRGISRRRGWCVTTRRDKSQRAAPDLVRRQFTATNMNQLWVADMTYLPTWAGFIYLAVVIDVYSRKVVGWAFSEQMTSELVIAALNMGITTRRPESVIHHSDQGSQYTSLAFGKRCAEMGVKPSMGTVGDAYDNAMAESFFASLECELINRRSWQTKSQARLAVFTWIESWYNPLRRHSGINYKSPNNFEKALNDEEIESNQRTPKSFTQEAQTVR